MNRKSLLLAALLATSGCSQQPSATPPTPTKPKVVTTVAPLTNIVRNIGGTRVEVDGVIPEGTDSHTFEPATSDARKLADADLILVNGLSLETPTEKLAEANRKKSTEIFRLGDHTLSPDQYVYDFSFPKEKGSPNPHLWMSVAYAHRYAELTAERLEKLDPAGKSYYQQNLKAYEAVLDKLDTAIKTAVDTIPAKNRKLVTYHDSFAYFAPRYGMTVIGAVQPADFHEPSPKDVAAIVEQLKKENVPAIFGSEVYPSKVIDQLGREAHVTYLNTLRDDDLPGPVGSPQHTYVGMMLEDVRTIVTSLGGNPTGLQDVRPADTYQK